MVVFVLLGCPSLYIHSRETEGFPWVSLAWSTGISVSLIPLATSLGNVRGKKKTQQAHCCVVLQVLMFLASVLSLFTFQFLVFLFYMSCPGFLAYLSSLSHIGLDIPLNIKYKKLNHNFLMYCPTSQCKISYYLGG